MRRIALGFVSMFTDALAFVFDADARRISPFKYPSGNPMSVRDAKKRGYMPSKERS